jgi:hypothetical protein
MIDGAPIPAAPDGSTAPESLVGFEGVPIGCPLMLLWVWAPLVWGVELDIFRYDLQVENPKVIPFHVTPQKKAPHSGHQMFVSHTMKTAGVKLPEAVDRWKALQPEEQDKWNQKCAAAKRAFKVAVAKKAL